MSDNSLTSTSEDESEYRAIEGALLETPRGRWFLREHSRRSRSVDSNALDDVICHLRKTLKAPPALLSVLRSDVERLRGFIATQRHAIADQSATTHLSGDAAQDPSAAQAETMLTATEDLHALVWSLRDRIPSAEYCEAIAKQASRIYALSHSQAIESDRAAQYVAALDEMYQRLSALLETILYELRTDEPPHRPAIPDRTQQR